MTYRKTLPIWHSAQAHGKYHEGRIEFENFLSVGRSERKFGTGLKIEVKLIVYSFSKRTRKTREKEAEPLSGRHRKKQFSPVETIASQHVVSKLEGDGSKSGHLKKCPQLLVLRLYQRRKVELSLQFDYCMLDVKTALLVLDDARSGFPLRPQACCFK